VTAYARSHSVLDETDRPCRSKIRTLSLEWNVIHPLVDEDLDRERERSTGYPAALALDQAPGLDATAASADVLLLLHLDELIANFDDVDDL